MRLTSFSLSTSLAGHDDIERDKVTEWLPWIRKRDLPNTVDRARLRNMLGQALNVALPHYDLVVIDEAHNLKGGVSIEDGFVACPTGESERSPGECLWASATSTQRRHFFPTSRRWPVES